MSSKDSRMIFHQELVITLYFSNISKEVSQLTDWKTYKKFRFIWNQCTNIIGMSPKNFTKISHTELEISLYLSNFSKEVNKLSNWQTCKKFRNILKECTNLQVMSPKDFRKISNSDLDISLYLSNFSK